MVALELRWPCRVVLSWGKELGPYSSHWSVSGYRLSLEEEMTLDEPVSSAQANAAPLVLLPRELGERIPLSQPQASEGGVPVSWCQSLWEGGMQSVQKSLKLELSATAAWRAQKYTLTLTVNRFFSKTIQWGKNSFFQHMALENWISTCKRMKLDPPPHTIYENQFKTYQRS